MNLQIFTTFRNPRDPDYSITFLTFLNAMTWAENAEDEKKIRGIAKSTYYFLQSSIE